MDEKEILVNTRWHAPQDYTPPFGEWILVLVQGFELSAGKRINEIITVQILFDSPNDSDDLADKSEYQQWLDGDDAWTEFQFNMETPTEDEIDWYSDSIVAWCKMPSELITAVDDHMRMAK